MASITVELHIPKKGWNIPNMGISTTPVRRPRNRSLADVLFSTKQQRSLGLLFGQPDRSFYATGLITISPSDILLIVYPRSPILIYRGLSFELCSCTNYD